MLFLRLLLSQIKYSLNKQSLFTIFICILLIILVLTLNTNIQDTRSNRLLFYEEYYYLYITNSIETISIILTFFSIFWALHIYNMEVFDLYFLIRIKRNIIILSKLLGIAFINILLVFLCYSLFILIPNIYMFYFLIEDFFYDIFIKLCIQLIFFSYLSYFLISITEHNISGLLVLVLYWIIKIMTDGDISKMYIKIITCFFPILVTKQTENISDIKISFLHSFPITLFSVLVVFIVNYKYYLRKDIK